MEAPVVSYSVRLQAWFRRDGQQWIAWSPAIDVATQARTKKRALESLREAVEAWFESCIERGVLDKALKEVGFTEVESDEEAPGGFDVVDVVRRPAAKPAQSGISFSLGRSKGADYIEGVIPAYIAAKQLGNAARARG